MVELFASELSILRAAALKMRWFNANLCGLSATFDVIPRPESVGQSMEGGVVKRLAGRDENSKTIRLLNVTLLWVSANPFPSLTRRWSWIFASFKPVVVRVPRPRHQRPIPMLPTMKQSWINRQNGAGTWPKRKKEGGREVGGGMEWRRATPLRNGSSPSMFNRW